MLDMDTLEFEENMSLDEEGYYIEEDYDSFDLNLLVEAVVNLSPSGKDIKEKIKKIIDMDDEDSVIDGTKNLVKVKGYDRKMCDKITSKVKAIFPISFHTDIIKNQVSVPISKIVVGKALYTQHWTALYNGHVYTFVLSYGKNKVLLVGPREQPVAFFNYPVDIIKKAIQWCDEGSELTFSKNKISSKGLDGAEAINNTLYDKLEKVLKEKKIDYNRTKFAIVFKQK